MELTRRDVIGAAAATLATGAAACGAAEQAPARKAAAAGAGFTLSLRLSGLFVFEVVESKRELWVSFADEAKTKPRTQSHDIDKHAGLMIMSLSSSSGVKIKGGALDVPPQVVTLGDQQLGVWGLEDHAVWIGSSHAGFDDTDPTASFKFSDSKEPWKGLDAFVSLADVLGVAEGQVPAVVLNRVRTRIRVTRGNAEGATPSHECEKERTYRLKRKDQEATPSRQYASEFVVSYPVEGAEVTIALGKRTLQPGGAGQESISGVKSITLQGGPGEVAHVTFTNMPASGPLRGDHFQGLPGVVGDHENVAELKVSYGKCSAPAAGYNEATRGERVKTSPPDGGCIPPRIVRS